MFEMPTRMARDARYARGVLGFLADPGDWDLDMGRYAIVEELVDVGEINL